MIPSPDTIFIQRPDENIYWFLGLVSLSVRLPAIISQPNRFTSTFYMLNPTFVSPIQETMLIKSTIIQMYTRRRE